MPETLLQAVLALVDQVELAVIPYHSITHNPSDQLAQLLSEGILRETSNATEIPRPERLGPGPDLVVRKTARGIEGVADEDDYFPPVSLSEDDVRQYEVSLPALVEKIRRENGIDGIGFSHDRGLFHIGQKALAGGGVVDVYLSLPNDGQDILLARCRRLDSDGTQRGSVLLTPCAVTPSTEARRILESWGIRLVALTTAAAQGSFALDLDSVVDTGRPVKRKLRNAKRFPTPLGTTWPQIAIRFIDGHTVTIVAGSTSQRCTFSEMNMKDGRNGNPNAQWKLLEILATNDGRLSWQNSAANAKKKKQVELLGRRLQDFFGIDESPFHAYKKGTGWQIKLSLEAPR